MCANGHGLHWNRIIFLLFLQMASSGCGDLFDSVTTDDARSLTMRQVEVPNGNGTWKYVAVGTIYACAINTGNLLYCWGDNREGVLGDGTQVNKVNPTQVGTDNKWLTIDAGPGSVRAVNMEGALFAWGKSFDQYVLSPTPISTSTDWASVVDGYALNNDGEVFSTTTLEQVGTEQHWVGFARGEVHKCAVKVDGALFCGGDGRDGALGNGTLEDSPFPTRVGSDSDWQTIAAGNRHTCALKTSGRLYCWGHNGFGQLGDGSTVNRATPTQVGADSDWASIAADGAYNCAVKSNGSLFCWGLFDYISGINHSTPSPIGSDSNWQRVAIGTNGICALKTDGSLYCWGRLLDVK